ncbi:MAG: retropepsin-like aspartic protease, partial [Blastocatellia bacterium]
GRHALWFLAMKYLLDFTTRYQFDSAKGGITLPTVLTVGPDSVECGAKVDTGAEYCLFQRTLAESLGISLQTGPRMRFDTVAGTFTAYGHEVTLQTFDLAFDVMVWFAEDYEVSRNLLGRNGWLDLVLLGLNSYDEVIYLKGRDEG